MRWCLVAMLLAVGCGGAAPSTDLLRDAQRLTAELGELEREALALTEGLVTSLTSSEVPDDALRTLEGYVEANVVRMQEVAVEVGARFDALQGSDHTSYHQVFADSMSEATFGWLDACASFIEANPEHEQRLRDAVRPLGPLRLPPSEDD